MKNISCSVLLLWSFFMTSLTLIAGSDNQLIKNGGFEQWENDSPVSWAGIAITRSDERSEKGGAVQFGQGKDETGIKSSISQQLPGLKPNTAYRLDFWTRRDKLRRGGVRFTIKGCSGRGLTFSGDGGYFSHLGGYRYTRYLKTGDKVNTNEAAIIFTGSYATLDGVSLAPISRGFTGIEYSESAESNRVNVVFGICNQSGKSRKYNITYRVTDYFGVPLIDETKEVSLPPEEDTVFVRKYQVGTSKRYRMYLKIVRDDGVISEYNRFYEARSYKTETRQYVNLRTLDWAMQASGYEQKQPPLDGEWKPVNMPENGRVGSWLDIARLPHVRLLNNNGAIDKPNAMALSKDYWGFIKADLNIPGHPANSRVRIKFNVTQFEPALFVDSALVARTEGSIPLTADITDAVADTNKCKIILRLASAKALYKDSGKGKDFRREVQFMSYQGENAGMRDDPWLQIVPDIRIEKVFIDTSVRKKELKLTYELRNDTRVSRVVVIKPEVLYHGEKTLDINPVPVLVYAEQSMRVVIKTDWENPKLWDIEKPNLYELKTILLPGSKNKIGTVAGAAPLDVQHERFGFKEIWTDGRNILLNGIVFRARSMLSSPNPSYTGVANNFENRWKQYETGLRGGIIFDNNHAAQRTLDECEIADEMGILQRPKLSLNMAFSDWRMTFADTPRFWQLSTEFSRALLEEFYNHPSVGWLTIENETFLCGTGDHFPSVFTGYRKIVEALKGMKPDLLVDFDGSDPGGISDIWNLHYPMKYQRWIPLQKRWNPPIFKDGQWMPFQLFPGAGIANGTKPLILGEDLIDYPEMPGSLSFLSDEDIYKSRKVHGQWIGNADIILQGIDRLHAPLVRAYRRARMAVITAWPLIGEVFTKDMAPVAVFIEEPWRNVFSGEKVMLHANIYYDRRQDFSGELTWSLYDNDKKVILSGKTDIQLSPGDMKRVDLKIKYPVVKKEETATLLVQLKSPEKIIADRKATFNMMPEIKYPTNEYDIFDPSGATVAILTEYGIDCKQTVVPHQGTPFIIGRDALNTPEFPVDAVVKFIKNGGRVFAFSQSGRVPEWLPVRLATEVGTSSFAAFPRAMEHPILKGINKSLLRYWRADGNVISRADYWKPGSGNVISILDTGNIGGFLTSAMLEQFVCKGSVVLSQLHILDNLGKDPAADYLLRNILEYTDEPIYRKPVKSVELSGGAVSKEVLADAGIPVSKKSNIIFMTGKVNDKAEIRSAIERVKRGDTLWLHGMDSDSASDWAAAGLAGLKVMNMPKHHLCKVKNAPIIDGLSNTDLHWEGMALAPMPGIYESQGLADIIEVSTELPGMDELIEHGALGIYSLGKGKIIIDNLRWAENLRSLPTKSRRIASILATNMGIKINPVGVDRSYVSGRESKYIPISVKAAANIPMNNNLVSGEFNDIPFDINSGTNGAVLVGSSILTERTSWLKSISKPITVNKKCNALYFLVTAYDPYEGGRGYGSGELIGGIDIKYADGTVKRQSLRHKVNVLNLFESMGDLREGKLVWQGETPFSIWLDKLTRWEGNRWVQREHPNRIYLVRWVNPQPEKNVESLQLFSTNTHVLPLLIGVTAEITASGK